MASSTATTGDQPERPAQPAQADHVRSRRGFAAFLGFVAAVVVIAGCASIDFNHDRAVAAEANALAQRSLRRQQTAGARTVIDVLNAKQAVLAGTTARVSAEHDAVVAAAQLLSVEGRLTAGQLDLKVPIYCPAAHFDDVHQKWIGTTPPSRTEVETGR